MLASSGLHFILFLGSMRSPRNADRVLPYVKQALENRNITVIVYDARELQIDKVVRPIQYYGQEDKKPEDLVKLNTQIINADGFVVMTAEYHGQIAPGLLNLMNQFPPNAYVFRPASIVSYSKGRYGGIRAAMQLRSYLADLGLLQMPAILSIPKVEEVFSINGTTTDPDVHKSMQMQIDQLVWFAEAIKHQREQVGYRCDGCYDENNLGSKGLPYKNQKWS